MMYVRMGMGNRMLSVVQLFVGWGLLRFALVVIEKDDLEKWD